MSKPYPLVGDTIGIDRSSVENIAFVYSTKAKYADFISSNELADFWKYFIAGDVVFVSASDKAGLVRITEVRRNTVRQVSQVAFSDDFSDISDEVTSLKTRVSATEDSLRNTNLTLPGQITFSRASQDVADSAGATTVALVRTGGLDQTVAATISYSGMTLTTEYTTDVANGSDVTFAPGEYIKYITITPVEAGVATDKTLTITISGTKLNGSSNDSIKGALLTHAFNVYDTSGGAVTTPTFSPTSISSTSNQDTGATQATVSVTISGLTQAVTAYTDYGFFRVNGGAWLSDQDSGATVQNGDVIEFYHIAANTPSTTVVQTLYVGTGTITYQSATAAGGVGTVGIELGQYNVTEGTTVSVNITRSGGVSGAILGSISVPASSYTNAATYPYTFADGSSTTQVISIPILSVTGDQGGASITITDSVDGDTAVINVTDSEASGFTIDVSFEGGVSGQEANTGTNGLSNISGGSNNATVNGAIYDDTHTNPASSSTMACKVRGTTGSNAIGGTVFLPEDLVLGDEIWVQGYWYLPSTTDFSTTAYGFKTIRIGGGSGTVRNGWIDIYLGFQTLQPKGPNLPLYIIPHTDLGNKTALNNYVSSVDTAPNFCVGSAVTYDDWNKFEMYIKFGTTAATSAFRIWQDDALIFDIPASAGWATMTNAAAVINHVKLSDNANDGFNDGDDFWVDDLYITTTRPSNTDAGGNYFIGNRFA